MRCFSSMPMRSVVDMAAAIRCGQLTARQAVAETLRASHAANHSLNAYTALFDGPALAQAEACDARAASGHSLGPLHGVPFAVKDLTPVAGTATTRGSHLSDAGLAQVSAPAVERLLQAGAILIGKTTTTEFGWKASSTGPRHGVTRNPHNRELTAGGSSCGSAAAVAAGAVPFALGSDGGGSTRIPAAFCGAFALKGSLGRIPAWPWSATEMLSHLGPITASARDSAYLFDLLKGPHWRDPQSLPADPVNYFARAAEPLPAGLRVAWAPSLFQAPVEPAVAHQVAQAVVQIGARLQISIARVELPWPDPFSAFEQLWLIGRGVVYGAQLGARRQLLDAGFARLIEQARRRKPQDYLRALQARAEFAQQVARSFTEFDLLLLPTVPVLPFAADADGPAAGWDAACSPVAWARWTPFTYPFNLTGQPAASMPCGRTSAGLPVGLQVVGARHADADVLQFCCAAERVLALPVPAPAFRPATAKGPDT